MHAGNLAYSDACQLFVRQAYIDKHMASTRHDEANNAIVLVMLYDLACFITYALITYDHG